MTGASSGIAASAGGVGVSSITAPALRSGMRRVQHVERHRGMCIAEQANLYLVLAHGVDRLAQDNPAAIDLDIEPRFQPLGDIGVGDRAKQFAFFPNARFDGQHLAVDALRDGLRGGLQALAFALRRR